MLFLQEKEKRKKKSYNLRWPLRRPQRTSRNTIRREDMSGKEEGERKKKERKRGRKRRHIEMLRAPPGLSAIYRRLRYKSPYAYILFTVDAFQVDRKKRYILIMI